MEGLFQQQQKETAEKGSYQYVKHERLYYPHQAHTLTHTYKTIYCKFQSKIYLKMTMTKH